MAVLPDRMEMIMQAVDQMSTHCEAWKEFHDELSNAANNNLLQHGYSSVDCEYTIQGDRILKLRGFVTFHSTEFNPMFKQFLSPDDYMAEPSPDSYQMRLHNVAKHIVEKYGKYMVDLKFGPQSMRPDRFCPVYTLEYVWNYIIP